MIAKLDEAEAVARFRGVFAGLRAERDRLADVTEALCRQLEQVYAENAPARIYHLMLSVIFRSFLEDINEDVLPNERTGFRDTKVWNTLYKFQQDAVLGLINKLETYNGCILADSFGLGKTFTALAVIKYYELRNRSVLVLCPKKLTDNWLTYNKNLTTNILAEDRFRYDVLAHTDLLRTGAILQGISPKTFALFGQNPEMFLRGAAELIRREKIALAIETLRYEKTGDRYDVSIFQTDRSDISLADAVAAKKHVYDYVAVDSDNERNFAKRLEAADEVIVYAKLPRGFVIPTPGGGYNPDWAIAIELNGERSIYFVAETKGSDMSEDLRAAEKQNIDSAKSYFRDIADNVTFRTIDSYDALLQAIS